MSAYTFDRPKKRGNHSCGACSHGSGVYYLSIIGYPLRDRWGRHELFCGQCRKRMEAGWLTDEALVEELAA